MKLPTGKLMPEDEISEIWGKCPYICIPQIKKGEKMIIPDWAVGLIFSLRARCKLAEKVTMPFNQGKEAKRAYSCNGVSKFDKVLRRC